MKIGALVPARLGSKRILKKNIKMLGGKPLICWTIDTLLESNVFSEITVSTESQEVTEVVRNYYSEKEVQIHPRPQAISMDDTPLTSVIQNYLKSKPNIDWLGLFMPTFPFRDPEKLKEAYRAISSFYPWRVVSITSEEDCSMDFYYPSENGMKIFFRHQPFYASYNFPVYPMHNIHVPDELWGKYGLSISERTFKIHLSNEECMDVDTENDFAVASQIAAGGKIKQTPIKQVETENWHIIIPKHVDTDMFMAFVNDKLTNTDTPLHVLESANPALSFYRYFDGNIRTYWINHEAHEYLLDKQYKETENSQDCPRHYRHSRIYRFIRKADNPCHMPIHMNDEKGILHLTGVGRGDDCIAKAERIIHIEDLSKAGFPINDFTISK